ncbi:MAG: TlpA family protein disulfide reductase [Cytophagales bacterium]|nr:MAG: TlpA family protein disulfide reductase [Cytophagales bacterium]
MKRLTKTVFFLLVHFAVLSQESNNNFIAISILPPIGIDNTFKVWNGMEVSMESPEIFISDNGKQSYIKLNPDKKKQVAIIDVNSDYVILSHRVNFIDVDEFVIQKGDSVSIRYQNKQPILTITNRNQSPYDTYFTSYFRRKYMNEKYSLFGRYLNPGVFINVDISAAKKSELDRQELRDKLIEKSKKDLSNKVRVLLNTENDILDSLHGQNLISQIPYDFYKSKNYYFSQLVKSENGLISDVELRKILEDAQGSSTIFDYNHNRFVGITADNLITKKSDFLFLRDGTNRDYRQSYNRIKNSVLFPQREKNYLLTREINRIVGAFSRNDFLKYFKLFEQDVKDSSMVNQMRDRYALEFDESRNEAKSLVLMDTAKEKQSFKQILEAHKGKVLYVDFWASWCAPCRAAMPQSAKLRQDLKDKNVVFVYLSIDKVFEQWKKANEKEGLEAYPNSYLITNAEVNEFIKQQKINSIPRYMIFDKQGKLAYPNAPRVESKGLAELLVKLAK